MRVQNAVRKKKSRRLPGLATSSLSYANLGCAALPILSFVFFFLTLPAFFLLSGLPVLLTGLAFLAMLSGLVARLSAVARLATLLSILFHIVCHEGVLHFALSGAQCDLINLLKLRCRKDQQRLGRKTQAAFGANNKASIDCWPCGEAPFRITAA